MSTKINCLIVDDEQLAREMLTAYVQEIPTINLVAACRSTMAAKKVLAEKEVDLLFLDIQMPQQTGVDFLEELNTPPLVVFTTAYEEYALKGYELNVVDYLLKPIALDRFKQAVDKAHHQLNIQQKAATLDEQEEQEEAFLLVHAEHKHHKIFLKDIIYIESLKEYVRYHTTVGKYLEYNTMKHLQNILPDDQFARIHRSYIVAINQVRSYEKGKLILKQPLTLPIGKTYKKTIIERLFSE